jgi:hypothetical protein
MVSQQMSSPPFNSLFTALMLISFISAFLIPPKFTNPARAQLQGLFAPISRPVRSLTETIYSHFHHEKAIDDSPPGLPRSDESLLEENRLLKMNITNLLSKLELLTQLNEDRKLVGNLRLLCTPAAVTGVDASGVHDSLSIISLPKDAMKLEFPPVIFAEGIVGRVSRAGLSGAQVRLITDPGFNVTGRVARLNTDTEGRVSLDPIGDQLLVQGIGSGKMAIRNSISLQKVHEIGLHINDPVLLDDHDWPENLQGLWLGRITSIQPQQNAPLFADIRVEPATDLMHLKEVMVFTGKN